jgi:hypothetical protein
MARHTFLGDLASWVMDTGAAATSGSGLAGDTTLVIPGQQVTFWNAQTSGSQYTDLLDATGSPITSVTSATDGSLPQISGPDSVTTMWADASGGLGPRRLAMATDLGTVLASLSTSVFLTPTAVKNSAYTANPGDFVPVDVSGGSVTITLPGTPADETRVGVKLVKATGTNTVTINCSGADHFNADSTTTATLKLLNQGVLMQYAQAAAVWYVQADDLPLSQLDARYSGGGVVLDSTASDIQPLGSGAGAGATGKAADAGHVHPSMPWLVVDSSGTVPLIRLGGGGPAWRTTGYNFWYMHPSEGATITAAQMDALFAKIRPGSLLRIWAYPTNPSVMTWASLISTYLDPVVAAAKKYGHRCILTLSTWADSSDFTNTGTGTSGGVKTTAWITGQQYLHSVHGANSLQDWVTTLAGHYANEPCVAIYDIMNEPADGTATNVSAWATYCFTVNGWIKALAPSALVYMGSADPFGLTNSVANYQTIIASMDLSSEHDYATMGFSWLGLGSLQGVVNKPMIADEYGFWGKGHYGAYTDTDLDDNGLPAMTWENQARITELYLESLFRNDSVFAALIWSLMDTDSNNAPYSAYAGLGQYEPLNQSRTHDVIANYPVARHPRFGVNTLGSGNMLSWINGAQAIRYPDGSSINTAAGTNSLQQVIFDLVALGEYNGPSTSAAGPVARHKSVSIRGQDWPTLQFSAAQFFATSSTVEDSGSATWFFVIYPTALPTGSGSTTFGYLVSPSTATTAAAIRVTSTGAVVLEQYAAATTGTVVGTSTALLTANQPALVMVQYTSGASWRIDVSTVITSGTTATTFTAAAVPQIGAAADGTNGFSGHLLEVMKFKVKASEGQISTVNAYLTRKYGLQF